MARETKGKIKPPKVFTSRIESVAGTQSMKVSGRPLNYEVNFAIDEPVDMEALMKLVHAMEEIREAGFSYEEENELCEEFLLNTDPVIRGALYVWTAHQQGEPVVIELAEGKKKYGAYQLFWDNDTIRKKKVKKAEFGVRDQKDNLTYQLEDSKMEPPFKLSNEERMLWEISPAMVISRALRLGDHRWASWVEELQEEQQKQKDYEDQTLTHFFSLQKAMYMIGKSEAPKPRAPNNPDGSNAHEEIRNARLAWSFLRNARIFHIDPSIYSEIYRASEIYCTEVLSGLKFQPPQRMGRALVYEQTEKSEQEAEHHGRVLRQHAPTAPMPEQYPFDVMFLGYGPGMLLNGLQAEGKFFDHGKTLPPEVSHIFVIGALVTATGYVFECYKAILHDGSTGYVCEPLRTPEEGFIKTIDLAPWYLPKIIEFIVSHKMFVLEQDLDAEQRRYARKVRKGTTKGGRRNTAILWTPPPYYRMRMRNLVIRDRARSLYPERGVQRSYRTDVVGHHRLYVRRGPMPLSPEKKAVLLQREYKVFEHTFPPAELTEALVRKGHQRKGSNEWVAIRRIWIDEHLNSSDDSLPYVPALRTTGQGSPSDHC